MQLSRDAQLAIIAAKEAGELIRASFGNAKAIADKGEGKSIVTEVDTNAEASIIHRLKTETDYSFLAEESGKESLSTEACWVIDPLDGTTNFTRGIPLLCTSIALMRDEQPVIGVIYNPMTNELYVAERGKGAFFNGAPMHVAHNKIPPLVLLEVGYGGIFRTMFSDIVDQLVGTYSIRKLGTTALECAYVASGQADVVVTAGDAIWDYAAGIVLIQEAGGLVTDWHGATWTSAHSYVCGSNGDIHPDIISRIAQFQPTAVDTPATTDSTIAA